MPPVRVEYPCGCEFCFDDEYDVFNLETVCEEHEPLFEEEDIDEVHKK